MGSTPLFAYIPITIDPVIVTIGPVALRWYGLMYVVGIVMGLWAIRGYTRRKGIHSHTVYRLLWWCIVAGLIGGHLYYVVQQPNFVSYYLAQPQHILATWEGGMAFFGAIFLVIPTIFWRSRAEQIRPWRFHSWQHIQDPVAFLERARPVLQLYEQAATLLKQGIWMICADEKTCIQAREAEQAPRPAIHQHPIYQSPRYIRHGVLHLMAALSVADGIVYGQCHPRKRFVDFRSFLETVVKDRASTSDGNLTIQLYWLPPNASWLDQIEIWFSMLQRKLLQPNHFISLDELERAIADYIRYYNQTAKSLEWSYTVEKLERKLAPRLRGDVKSAAT